MTASPALNGPRFVVVCDTIVSLAESGVLFAKNSDRDPNEAQLLEWVPAADHPPSSVVRCTWIDVPQVAHTYGTVLSRPWWTWGAEMGANEHGVVIGNEAVFTKGLAARVRRDGPALLGMDLLRLALERAATAEDAVATIVSLLERHGQGGPCSHDHPRFTYDNSYLIADTKSAFVLETVGREWEAEAVPAGSVRSLSNALTIPAFAATHTDRLRTKVAGADSRRACSALAAQGAVGPVQMMAALRSHGPAGSGGYGRSQSGTAANSGVISGSTINYSTVNGAMAAPCMHAGGLVANSQTTASWVSDLRGEPLHWVTATAAPCTSVFKPVRVDEPLSFNPPATGHHDPRSIWWRHETLHRVAARDMSASLARFAHERDAVEAGWLDSPPSTDDAFELAAELELKWAVDLINAELPDVRPPWVKAYWANQNRRAGMNRTGTPRSGAVQGVDTAPRRAGATAQ